MVPIEADQRVGSQRLGSKTHPSHPAVTRYGDKRRGHVERIRLNRYLCAGGWLEPSAEYRKELAEPVRTKMRGRSAAKIERVYTPGPHNSPEFPLQRQQIAINQIVPPGDQCEIAVATAVAAERNMHVGVSNGGGHSHTWSRPSSRSGSFLARIRRIRSSVYRVE